MKELIGYIIIESTDATNILQTFKLPWLSYKIFEEES